MHTPAQAAAGGAVAACAGSSHVAVVPGPTVAAAGAVPAAAADVAGGHRHCADGHWRLCVAFGRPLPMRTYPRPARPPA